MRVILAIFGVFIWTVPCIMSSTKYSGYIDYSVPKDCELNDRRPNLLDPYSFYWCLYDGPLLMKCVSGKYFDVNAGECILEKDESKTPVAATANSATATNATTSAEEEPKRCPQPEVTPKSIKCPPTDPIDRSIYFADPNACECFYQCDNGVAKRIPCRVDLHFNATTNLCDWPEEAGCMHF